jgi:hypothetical protein
VRRHTDAFFWFEGRTKQIIVRGGSNISPQEVEGALHQHRAVLEAGVIGAPDPVHGEEVIASVAVRDGLYASEQELLDLVRSRIADYKVPEHILFLPMLPKGLTGKVDRRALRELTFSPRLQSALAIQVSIDERVPALSFFWGDPSAIIPAAHAAGIAVLHQFGSVDAAIARSRRGWT